MTPSFQFPPDPTVCIWRFMDFTKFVALLDGGNLWFARSDKFEDTWEMSYPSRMIEQLNADVAARVGKPANEIPTSATYWRKQTFINCWHLNPVESAAMWKLYPSNNEGIAVVSSPERLEQSLSPYALPHSALYRPLINNPEHKGGAYQPLITIQPMIGMVEYLDFATETLPDANPTRLAFIKRKSFEHEHELRAVFEVSPPFPEDQIPEGINISVELSHLIETVYVALRRLPGWSRSSSRW